MIAVPMKSKSADDVIHAYVETILPQIGPSRFILTDNGTEFKNDTMAKVLNRLNTEHKFTTVYFARGNSRLENSHTLLKRSISKYIDIKFISGYQVVRILSDNAYELRKPNRKTFKVNTHHIRPFGNATGKRNGKRICDNSSFERNLRNRDNIKPPVRLAY